MLHCAGFACLLWRDQSPLDVVGVGVVRSCRSWCSVMGWLETERSTIVAIASDVSF